MSDPDEGCGDAARAGVRRTLRPVACFGRGMTLPVFGLLRRGEPARPEERFEGAAAASAAWCPSHRELLFLPGKAASVLEEVA